MNRTDLKKLLPLMSIVIFGLLETSGLAQRELYAAPPKTFPKGYVHPLTEINLEKIFGENRGLKVLEENATMVHDYYRGGVQAKEEADKQMKEAKWEEARKHLEQSIRFLKVVLRYLPEDEAYFNIYGDQVVIFLPNLLMADNDLKLITVYKNLKEDDKIAETIGDGEYYLAESLKTVKTEWANQIKKAFQDERPRKR